MTNATGNAPAPSTTIIPAGDVAAAFATGRSFIETPEYRVGVARREGPGHVEVHTVDTDIFYVIEGSATLVTGGEMLEPENAGTNEVRGSGIRGGDTNAVSTGNMIIIPNTVPHWFKEVTKSPFVYLVVKSTSR